MRQAVARALFLALVLVFSGASAPASGQGLSGNEVKAFQDRATALCNKGRYGQALAVAEEWAKAAEKSEGQKPGAATATALGYVAWYALFANRTSRALSASERAMALQPDVLWIETNRAHALLFLDRTKMAIAAYIAHKGETLPDNSKWDDAILKDFAEFRKRKLDHPHLRRVEEALATAPDSPEVLDQIAAKLSKEGKYAEALPFAERYLAAMKIRYGENHAKYAMALANLASRYREQNRRTDAEPLLKQALAIRERVLGSGHTLTLITVVQLGQLYTDLRQEKQAELFLKQALDGFERELGANASLTLVSADSLALLYYRQGRYAEAGPLYLRTMEAYERISGKENPQTLATASLLLSTYERQGKYVEAEGIAKRILEAGEHLFGKDDPFAQLMLNTVGIFYSHWGHYAEAEQLYRRDLEAKERILGPDHSSTLATAGNLAQLYNDQGRYAEAEQLSRRVFDTNARVFGKEDPRTLSSAAGLASVFESQGHYAEAEPLWKRALEVNERRSGKEHLDTLISVNNLARLYQKQGRYAEAEPLYKRYLEVTERTLGAEAPLTLQAANNLATLYLDQGRYAEAGPLYKRAVEGRERMLGKDAPQTLTALNNLANYYREMGRYAEAEALLQRFVAASERVQGIENPRTITGINNLAAVYDSQQRYEEAEALYKRAVETRERVLGPEHPDTIQSVNNLGELYFNQKLHELAEPLLKRAFEVSERVLGKEHPNTLIRAINLASLYMQTGRHDEAEALFQTAVAVSTRVLGQDHPQTITAASGFGALYLTWGRYADAAPLLRRALESREHVLGAEHPDTLYAAYSLGLLAFEQSDFVQAVEFFRRNTAGLARRTLRGALQVGAGGSKKSEAALAGSQFQAFVKAAYLLPPSGAVPGAPLIAETFEAGQWAQSSDAAQSLSQMAARGAAVNPELATLARERQDLVLEWRKRDALRDAELAKPAAKRDAIAEAENTARLAAIDARLAEIDAKLKAEFPDYAALASPAPLSLAEAQALLGENEALVLFLDTPDKKPTPEETFIWVATETQARWVRSDLGKAALVREVEALRCGLDAMAWSSGSACAELTGQQYSETDAAAGKLLPFDPARAHKLYKALFGQAEDLIQGKQLLLVPSGALTQLPFQVLVTAEPKDGTQPAWLIRDHALTVLPAVSSLKALRRLTRAGKAEKPMTGFGNPLLDGPDERYGPLASEARGKTSCTAPQEPQKAVPAPAARGGGMPQLAMRGGLADATTLRKAPPLPETADELCAVAADLGAAPDNVYLGARATEGEVKRLSRAGELSQYRIVHFATHGALAGQVKGSAEPGLLLTPPDTPSEEDDGYLTASEVAGLKLDADWVVLSACNTAAGGAQGAEALSGLARAFIYAQARALLVSHWEVNSEATVKLITGAMKRLAADKGLGRAEAMRQSMLALMDSGTPREAQPAYWAPFVVVGEGGAGR